MPHISLILHNKLREVLKPRARTYDRHTRVHSWVMFRLIFRLNISERTMTQDVSWTLLAMSVVNEGAHAFRFCKGDSTAAVMNLKHDFHFFLVIVVVYKLNIWQEVAAQLWSLCAWYSPWNNGEFMLVSHQRLGTYLDLWCKPVSISVFIHTRAHVHTLINVMLIVKNSNYSNFSCF